MSVADTRGMTTSCRNCKRYVTLVPTEDSRVFVSVNRENGFNAYGQPQVAGERHVCGERDRAAY
jgi:hypothetical protein